MRAIEVERFGAPDVLRPATIERPAPGPDEALVRVTVAGVNFVDVYIRTGAYPGNVPYVPGQEGAGVVEAVGANVTGIRVGERVAWNGSSRGSYAQYTLVPAWRLVPIPDGIDDRVACAAMLQAITAHYLAHDTYALGPDDTALVHAGAGGVGLLLTQMARARGATVIATVSSDAKAALSRDAGAGHTIDYTQHDFVAEVKRITGGSGVNVVYDSVGATTFAGGLDVLRPRGTMVLYGAASGPVPSIEPQQLATKGSLYITRPTAVHYTRTREEIRSHTDDIFASIQAGTLRVRVEHVYPLDQAERAHVDIAARSTTGKLVLIP